MRRTKAFNGFGIWFFIVGILVASSPVVLNLSGNTNQSEMADQTRHSICLQVGENCYDLEVADNDEERMRGLSGRSHLPADRGMLFVFDQAEEQCFWMKDMKFSLDIVWADEQKRIIKVEKNISPSTYPDSFCADNAKYVLEFNTGFVSEHGLKAGTELQF